MDSPTAIFLGVTPKPLRDYLAGVFGLLKDDYEYLVNPCVGTFGIIQAAVSAGWSPAKIVTSDISLFSSVLGFLAAGESLDALNVTLAGSSNLLLPYLRGNDTKHGAAILLALWLANHDGKNAYLQRYVRELQYDLGGALDRLAARLETMLTPLQGLTYTIADAREEVMHWTIEPRAVISFAPPWYKGGYAKMWSSPDVQWAAPVVPELTPDEAEEMSDALDTGQALSLLVRSLPKDEILPDAVAVLETGRDWTACILSNQPERLPARCFRKALRFGHPRHPLWSGQEVTAESAVSVELLTLEEAQYCRELWTHLAVCGVGGQVSLGLLLDGKLAAVSNYTSLHLSRGQTDCLAEIFAIAAPNDIHLARLMSACLLSYETRDLIDTRAGLRIYQPSGMTSKFLTPHPALSRLRGLMKLTEREQQKDGTFILSYRGEWHKRSWAQCLADWLKKNGSGDSGPTGD